MTKKKKRQILAMTLVSLIICSILLWKVLDNADYSFFKDNNSSPTASTSLVISKKDVTDFIYNYSLNTIETKEYEDLTNQDKLNLIVRYLLKQGNVDFTKGVDKNSFETYIHYVFGVEATIENEDIIYNGITIKYNEKKGQYISDEELTYDIPNVFYEHITDYKVVDKQYSIDIKLVYENNQKLYGNIVDYNNSNNVIAEKISKKEFTNTGYDEVEDKVTEMEYNFELEGNHLVLKQFKQILDEE